MLQIEHISKEKPELSNYEYIVLAAKEWVNYKKIEEEKKVSQKL